MSRSITRKLKRTESLPVKQRRPPEIEVIPNEDTPRRQYYKLSILDLTQAPTVGVKNDLIYKLTGPNMPESVSRCENEIAEEIESTMPESPFNAKTAPGSNYTVEKSREGLPRRNKSRKTLPLPKTPLDEMLDRHRSTSPIYQSTKPSHERARNESSSARGKFKSKEELRKEYKHRPAPMPPGSTNVYESIPDIITTPSMRSPEKYACDGTKQQDNIESKQGLCSHCREQEPVAVYVNENINTLPQQGRTSASNSYQPTIVQQSECDKNQYMTI